MGDRKDSFERTFLIGSLKCNVLIGSRVGIQRVSGGNFDGSFSGGYSAGIQRVTNYLPGIFLV